MRQTPEGGVTKKIKKYLTQLLRQGKPIWFFKVAGGYYQKNGIPDWHITYRGRSIWIEVKKPEFKPPGKLTLQDHNINKIQKAGGVSCYVTSVDELNSIIERLDKEHNCA